ncbi:MAG: hypothetical protein LBI05_10940 [Planctomycetaceae bacterium]|jgi:hypothetical protein|nr:hypothetical protein [Planctomycetaceae bacterium]
MSPRDKKLTVLLSEEERELLKSVADSAGFANVADYVRHMTIGDGKGIHADIREDVRKILKILQEGKE